MKRLDLYLLKELAVPFLIGTVAVVLMFQANTYMYLGKSFNLENVPPLAVLQVILYQTPEYLNMTLLAGTALGTSLAMSRIARESELTAMRAVGTPILRALVPFLALGVVVSLGSFYIEEKVMPPASKKAREVGAKIGIVGLASDMKENAIIPLRGQTIMVGLVQRHSPENLGLTNVIILRQPRGGQLMLIMAPAGTYNEGVFAFPKCRMLQWEGENVKVADVGKMQIHERILSDALFSELPEIPTQTVAELQKNIAFGKKQLANVKYLEVELHQRFSVPAACFVFSLVGPVFAIMFARNGGFVGVFLSIVMVMLYYNAYVVSGQILSKFDFMPAWAAAWLPDGLFFLGGVWGLRRLE